MITHALIAALIFKLKKNGAKRLLLDPHTVLILLSYCTCLYCSS